MEQWETWKYLLASKRSRKAVTLMKTELAQMDLPICHLPPKRWLSD